MSVNLGSAHGEIVIKSDKATQGAQQTIAAIKSMEQEASASGRGFDRMASSGERAMRSISNGAQDAEAGLQGIDQATAGAAQGLDRMGTAAAVLGTALVAGLAGAAKAAADLESQVALISTIRPDINVSQVGDEISAMSTRVAQSTTQLSESLYNVFSSVEVSQAEALRLTEQFAQGAVAARTDAETFGTAILGVMNAYKMEVSEAGHVSDVFFNTINKGVVTGEELAGHLGNVSQAAKNAGVSFDTLGALIAGVTKEGGQASVNINNLNNVLQKLVTSDAQKGINDLGVATKDAQGNFRNILDVLTDLNAVLAKMSQSERATTLQNLFPDAQARTGLQTLLSQLEFIEGVANDNAKAVNVASDAYAKMGATAAAQGTILKNTLLATFEDIGAIILPDLVGVAQDIQALVGIFNSLPGGVRESVVQFVALSAILLVIGGTGVKVVVAFQSMAGALTAMAGGATAANTSLIALAGRLAMIVGPFILLGKAFETLWGTSLPQGIASIVKYGDAWGEGREKAQAAFEANKENLTEVTKLVDAAEQRIKVLQPEINKLYEGVGLRDPGGLLNDPTRLRRLEAERENLEKYIETLHKLAEAENEARRDTELRERSRLPEGFIGAPNPIIGPPVPPGYAATLNEYATAATAAATANTVLAPTFTATGTAAAGAASVMGGGMIAALTAVGNAAAPAIRIQEMQDYLAKLATEAQNVTTSVTPLQGALDLLNQKVAQGIPLTAEQQHLYQSLPGYIAAATSSYDQLVTAQAQAAIAIQNATSSGTGAGANFSTLSGQAAGLQTALDNLRASAIALEGAIGALGTENGKLGAEYNILNERVTALNEKKKEGAGLSAAEASELAVLEGALGTLGGAMGVNAAKQRDLILQLLGVQTATTDTATALAGVTDELGNMGTVPTEATSGLVGLTDGLGNVAGAAGTAITPVQAVANAIQALPTQKTVTVDFQVTGAADGGAAFNGSGQLNEFNPGEGGDVTRQVTVDLTDNATPKLTAIQQLLTTINTTTADPDINVTDNATAKMENVRRILNEVNALTADPDITATDLASPVASTVTANVAAIPPAHDTVITATDQASGTIGAIAEAINNLPTTFNITASVDTSGAMAAIATLRANMPSSPAKEGPFRTLPDWSVVYESLEPAGQAAVESTQTTVGQLAEAITSGMSEAEQEAAKAAADLASAVANAVNAAYDALTKLRSFRAPHPRQFELLREALLPILQAFSADAAGTTEESVKAANTWADNANKIFGALSAGVDVLAKLRGYVRPADRAIQDFRDSAQYLVNLLIEVARDSDIGLTLAGQQWAEAATSIFTAVGAGIEALTGLSDFTRPADKAATDFRDISQYVVNLMAQVAADIEDQALPKAEDWANTANAIFQALGTGVDALMKLHEFTRPTDKAATDFRDIAQFVVNILAQVAADIEDQALPKAKEWAETALAIFQMLGTGVDALMKLEDFVRPTDEAVRAFADATQFAVNTIAAIAAQTDAEMVAAAAVYAEGASQVLSLIGAGMESLNGLGGEGNEFTMPDEHTLSQIAEATRLAVIAVAEAARLIEQDLVDDAGTYADGAGKAVGLIGEGLSAFADIGGFVPPTEAQIRQLVNVMAETVRRIAEAAQTMDQEAVTAAGEFGESAGKAIGVIGATLGAFGKLDEDWVAPSAESIDAIVAVTHYAATRLAEIAGGFSPETLKRLGEFGDGVGSALGAIRSALDIGKSFQDEDRISPADAIGTALQEFTAGLGPLDELLRVSETYKTKGTQIGMNMAAAYAGISAGYPGMDAERSLVMGDLAVSGAQTIIHRYEGSITFQMMDENGGWIVRSLAADGSARQETAAMIVDEIFAAQAAA